MKRLQLISLIALPTILFFFILPIQSARAQFGGRARTVTTGTLLEEMTDLARLGRMPDPSYTTVQFSSYDRRSVSPDQEGWFSNSDGFGGEPIPGFQQVLREPGADGIGLYLLLEEAGPGAVVRTWSAGMGGTLRVFLDGSRRPMYEGDAYRFLARKSEVFLEEIGVEVDCGDAFCQQDADYFPIPFRRSLTITWEGDLAELHFYHVEVRRYQEGTPVRSFNPERFFRSFEEELRGAVAGLTAPSSEQAGTVYERSAWLAPGTSWDLTATSAGTNGAITLFSLSVTAPDRWKALRGTLLQISFDGAGRHQVEAPAGDFFGSGPGVNPFDSLPMTVAEDGTMTCRFVMPFMEKALFRLTNASDDSVRIETVIRVSPWQWDDRSLYFRAKWRSGTDLDLSSGPLDLPFVLLRGRGRLVGAASILVNPSATPTPGGNWWGEGDEKIFVDGEPFPVFFGTGTEDYYNYSWSRPDLFDHPYCGQPLDTGPGNIGYVSNHRWHILDSIPFTGYLAFYIELWHHQAFPGLCYDRIAFCYAGPGAWDDHRRIQNSELVVRDLPSNEPQPLGGARNSTFHHLELMPREVSGGNTALEEVQPGASMGRLLCWYPDSGDRLAVTFELEEAGEYTVNLVAAHWPESGSLRVLLDGTPLTVANLGGAGEGERSQPVLVLRSGHARRLLSSGFQRGTLEAGTHELVLECVEAGRFGFDYLWIKKH